jgi:hypothetical protein
VTTGERLYPTSISSNEKRLWLPIWQRRWRWREVLYCECDILGSEMSSWNCSLACDMLILLGVGRTGGREVSVYRAPQGETAR